MLNPIRLHPIESLIGVLLIALLASALFSGFATTGVDACTPALSFTQEYRKNRKRKYLKPRDRIRQLFVQYETRRMCCLYLRYLAVVVVAVLFVYRWQSADSLDFTLFAGCVGVPVSSQSRKHESQRVRIIQDGTLVRLEFQVPVAITIDKNNKDMVKLLNVALGWFDVLPTQSCNGHHMSLRETAQCTGVAPSTVKQHQNRFAEGGLKELTHKGMGVKLPWEFRKKIYTWILEDPLASRAHLAFRANEEQIGNVAWTAEHVAACLRQVDFNEIQAIIIQLVVGKTSTYLVDKLLQINEELVRLVNLVPMQVKMQLDEVKKLRERPGLFTPSHTTLDEKRSSSDTIQSRRRLKLYLLRIQLGFCIDAQCPHCGTTQIGKKEVRTSSVQTKEGAHAKRDSVRYYCKNAACPTNTFTLPDSWRELGAQRAKEVKEQGLNRLFHMRSSLRHGADAFFGSFGINHATLLHWIQREAQELAPWYTLFTPIACKTIVVDEKWVKFHKAWYYVFMAVEPNSGDLLHINVYTSNSKQSAKVFLAELRSFGFRPQVIVTDSLGGYHDAVHSVFPRCQHMECIFHGERAARRAIRDSFGDDDEHGEELVQRMKHVFRARKKGELTKAWRHVRDYDGISPKMVTCLKKYLPLVEIAIQNPNSPRTTNSVERVIQEFDRKYKDMQCFSSFHSMQSWCILFQVYYRLRPYKRGYRKGRSPAQVMGYPVSNLTWIDYVVGVMPERSAAIAS